MKDKKFRRKRWYGTNFVIFFVTLLLCHFVTSLFASPKVIAILPFNNLHNKAHLEFVKNIVHETLFTKLTEKSEVGSQNSEVLSDTSYLIPHTSATVSTYIVIGVGTMEDVKELFRISNGKVPTVVLQGEYFMIRDRMAINVSLLNPKDGERIDGTGELVRFKGYRYNNLPKMWNFQKSLEEDMREPLNKLIKEIRDLIDGKKKKDR